MSVKHFLKDDDLTSIEQMRVIDYAIDLKAHRSSDKSLDGKTVALLFDKPSTRTRVSFSVGVFEMGGYPLVLDLDSSQLGRGEPIADTARVLDRQCSMIAWRTHGQERVEEMAKWSSVPVINALTNEFHPCQTLADFMTIKECLGGLQGIQLTYLGDIDSNMSNSYLLAGALSGMHVRLAGPSHLQPSAQLLERAKQLAEQSGGSVLVTDDPKQACIDADVVATDTWVSMDKSAHKSERTATSSPFNKYQVNNEMMSYAKDTAVFLHCLPAYRECEVAGSVIDGPRSVVWQEAENRLHVQKSLMSFLLDSANQ